jgi:hypothetical protein
MELAGKYAGKGSERGQQQRAAGMARAAENKAAAKARVEANKARATERKAEKEKARPMPKGSKATGTAKSAAGRARRPAK